MSTVMSERRSATQKKLRSLPAKQRAAATVAAMERAQAKKPELIIDCKYVNELPKPPVPKLLKALPSAERLCRYEPSQLELDCRPFLLTEQDLLTRVVLMDSDVYGDALPHGAMPPPPPPQDAKLLNDDDVPAEVKEAEAKRRRLHERTEADHRQAFGLQLPQLVTNDIFTERQKYITGMASAEKKLHREPPGFNAEDLAAKIEKTFEAAKLPPVHPTRPKSMKAKRVLDIVPDAVLWANRYRQIVFDQVPQNPVRDDLLFKTAPMPRVTCFGFFSPAPEGEPGSYRLGENYFWDNRGDFTKQTDCGEGEAMLLSFPTSEDPKGEARFVTVPAHMKLRKQKAFRLDINLDTKVLNVTHRDPSAQEAAEEQERMNVVLSDEVGVEKSEASLDFVDGEWQIRGDPRSASGRSKPDATNSGEPGSQKALPFAASPVPQSPVSSKRGLPQSPMSGR